MATILQCAHLSAAAYADVNKRANILAKESLALGGIALDKEIKSRNGYQGFIASSHDTVYIAIEGTASTDDWVADAKALKTYNYFFGDKRLVGIHMGFHELFLDVWPDIKEFIDAQTTNNSVVVTGHSLGGALATLVAAALSTQTPHAIEVVTFGSPRVGNHAFMKKFNASVHLSTRVVRDLDIVPRAPKFDYWHVDTLVHLTDDGKRMSFWKSWLKQAWYIYKNIHFFLSKEALDDHNMQGYVKAVELMK